MKDLFYGKSKAAKYVFNDFITAEELEAVYNLYQGLDGLEGIGTFYNQFQRELGDAGLVDLYIEIEADYKEFLSDPEVSNPEESICGLVEGLANIYESSQMKSQERNKLASQIKSGAKKLGHKAVCNTIKRVGYKVRFWEIVPKKNAPCVIPNLRLDDLSAFTILDIFKENKPVSLEHLGISPDGDLKMERLMSVFHLAQIVCGWVDWDNNDEVRIPLSRVRKFLRLPNYSYHKNWDSHISFNEFKSFLLTSETPVTKKLVDYIQNGRPGSLRLGVTVL